MIISKDEIEILTSARCGQPHDLLGMHKCRGGIVVRAYLRDAKTCRLIDLRDEKRVFPPMKQLHESGLFELFIKGARKLFPYAFKVRSYNGDTRTIADPYAFQPTLSPDDLYLIGKGDDKKIYRKLGSHIRTIDGVAGTSFAVWAPTARRVSVVGDFNGWDGRYHQMRELGQSGIWEIFVPAVGDGAKYKFEIVAAHNDTPFLKIDPYALHFEAPPYNSSIVCDISGFEWSDSQWLAERAQTDWSKRPVSVYEVHLGSWKRVPEDGFRPLTYAEIGARLADYCTEMGFTHVEFLPLSEYPFEGSWGYQVTGYYAPTHRYGSPRDFMKMVDTLHKSGIGVIMDWVPAHFPRDSFALAGYDGSCLYEHQDPRLGSNPDWGTLCFNYGRNEVSNFLTGSALAWFDRFHIDGLRVDAVASMLYLNFSRRDWLPNRYGGSENLEAIEFIKRTNTAVHEEFKGSIMIAEESTTFRGVTAPAEDGGLGFDFKWNLGWMHDTLEFCQTQPDLRPRDRGKLLWSMHYFANERYLLPLSHDEVVHGKASIVQKMWGADEKDKYAQARTMYLYMFAHPGKKLNFMGNELGQLYEWNEAGTLDGALAERPFHLFFHSLCRTYRDNPALHCDYALDSFSWADSRADAPSLIGMVRRGHGETLLALCNFGSDPAVYDGPLGDAPSLLLHTDLIEFGGDTEEGELNIELPLLLPPYSGMLLRIE